VNVVNQARSDAAVNYKRGWTVAITCDCGVYMNA